MTNGRDGGIWALGGYLYQIVGALGITARASNFNQGNVIGDNQNLDILIELLNVNQGDRLQVQIERLGEDALLRNFGLSRADTNVFVQYKYSRTIPPISLSEADLRTIVLNFDRCVRDAAVRGVSVSACVLITNRPFSMSGNEYWENEVNQDREYQLRSIIDANFQNFIDEMEMFAQPFGAFDHEINQGLNRLIGRLVRGAGQQAFTYGVFEEDLIEAFTESRQTHRISAHYLFTQCNQQLRDYAQTWLRIDQWNNNPIERDAFQELSRIVKERSFIGLCGQGGCGKSILLWHLLSQNAENNITHIERAANIRTDWISYQISRSYRNIPVDIGLEDSNRLFKRLLISNQRNQKPIWWVGLDGLDEIATQDQRQQVREVLLWFWEKDKLAASSDAVLITSFRRHEQLYDFLGIPYDYQGLQPYIIYLNNFSDRELEQALDRVFPELQSELTPPIERALTTIGGQSGFKYGYEKRNPSISNSIAESLRHPITWRALLNLDAHTRKLVLDGVENALDQLAREFLNWFEEKVNLINPYLNIRQPLFDELLREIASVTSYLESWPNQAWIDIVTRSRGDTLAAAFFDEADRSGIIEKTSRSTWKWKHEFIYSFLSKIEDGQ